MKILVAGDYVPRNRLVPLIQNNQFEEIFGQVREIISSADYAIVNFESPVVEDGDIPIKKCGPNLRCTPKAVDAIKYAGFTGVTLANNHIRDFGDSAVERTISELSRKEVDYVGAGSNIQEASETLFKTIGDECLAIINCCENEFSIATNEHFGANPLNPVKQYYAIQEAKSKADHVVVIVHGGYEHFQLPSPRMVETYRFFIDAGADAVVNHHQHCYSGYETYKGKLIFYGLGNFCFDNPLKRGGIWSEGYMVTIDFTTEKASFELHPYIQFGEEPKVKLLKSDAFDARVNELNGIISNSEILDNEIEKYYWECMKTYSDVIEPIRNKFYLAAKHRKWLPSLISMDRKLLAYNYINCESHRDKMLFWLNKEI